MTDMITATDIQLLRNKLAQAESQYAQQRKANRQEVAELLAEKINQIDATVRECEKLAESADMVFWYSPGYEGFCTEDKENWSESSLYC
jgi:hypothetical protein